MSNNIVQFNEEIIKGQIKELVRGSVEETLKTAATSIGCSRSLFLFGNQCLSALAPV